LDGEGRHGIAGEGDVAGGAQGASREAELPVARQERHVTAPHVGGELGELEVGGEWQAAIGEGDIDQDPGHRVMRGRPRRCRGQSQQARGRRLRGRAVVLEADLERDLG
jgi:hypothetical protein